MKPWSFLRLFLGLLFTATGLAKLLDNRGFAQVIASYQLGLPGLFLLPLGLCISLAEVWIGTNLLRARRVRLCLWGTLLFLVGYGALAAMTLRRGSPHHAVKPGVESIPLGRKSLVGVPPHGCRRPTACTTMGHRRLRAHEHGADRAARKCVRVRPS